MRCKPEITTERFHVYEDNGNSVCKEGRKHFIINERELSYCFSLHFHPYIDKLVQQLLLKSTDGLQAADTEYNTRIQLCDSTAAKNPEGNDIELAIDETVYLLEGATAMLDDGRAIRFAGSKVINQLDETLVTPPSNTIVTVQIKTMVRRTDGSLAILDDEAKARLMDGVPRPVLYADFFESVYKPSDLVMMPYPVKDLDFTFSGAYSIYNWELFCHVPITIAIHLSKNQRFAEAQRWFHYLFDPTDDSDGSTPERFWKVRPFQSTDIKKIEEILVNLAPDADPILRDETILSIDAWKDAPFRPHVIARYRQQAYMYKTVMAYLDNLIAWGDSLFRQDTGEAIDEAMMAYVLAANILGPRPLPVPRKGSMRPQTYANLRSDLDKFGNAMRDMEADVPFDLMPFPTEAVGDNDRLATMRSLGKALYFCVPRNDKMLGYWDTVADRLFKIRNSMNIRGTFRQLALFEPPIDPAMLARAAAAGLDVGAIINGLNQPLPLVRFQLLVQKAAEICQEVKSLGNNLLSVMEREDGEALMILRARHESIVMGMVEDVKYGQLQEAIKSKEGLFKSLALAVQRYSYYELQLGKKADEIENAIPELEELDKDSLAKMKFAMEEPELAPHEIEVDIAQDLGASGGKIISSHEKREFESLESATKFRQEAVNLDMIAKFLSLIPEVEPQAEPMGVGTAIQFGGRALSTQLSLAADGNRITAERDTHEAGKSAKIGSYARREQDWAFQSNLATGEITQIFKQLRAAQIREAIADLELNNHRKQMEHAEEIERFLGQEDQQGAVCLDETRSEGSLRTMLPVFLRHCQKSRACPAARTGQPGTEIS
jgi:hypothetical protein